MLHALAAAAAAAAALVIAAALQRRRRMAAPGAAAASAPTGAAPSGADSSSSGSSSGSIPITLVAGFLGSGKSTILAHLLRSRPAHAPLLGLVVNDLSTDVNVDGRLLGAAAAAARPGGAGAKGPAPAGGPGGAAIELVDGCACCSGASGLRAAVDALAARTPPPACILIELSGVALPAAAAAQLRACAPAAALDAVITVVDVATMLTWMQPASAPAAAEGRGAGPSGDAGAGAGAGPSAPAPDPLASAVAEALAQQLEAADVVILSKADGASPARLAQCRAAVRALNPNVVLHAARWGAVPPAALLRTGLRAAAAAAAAAAEGGASAVPHAHAHAHGHGHGHGACSVPGCSHRGPAPGTDAGSSAGESAPPAGYRSFVARPARPLHPERLAAFVAAARAGAGAGSGGGLLSGLLRAKGLLWVASCGSHARELAYAGGRLEIMAGERWAEAGDSAGAAAPASPRAPASPPQRHPLWGDRRTELVFIGGPSMDEAGIRSALDACALTDAEWAGADGGGGIESGGGARSVAGKGGASAAAAAALARWAALPDPLAVAAPLAERVRGDSAAHGSKCPCCDPELRALESFVLRGM